MVAEEGKGSGGWDVVRWHRWGCLAKYERDKKGRAGMRPVMTKVIRKSSGEMCVGRDETLLRWQEHFCNVLN